MSLKVVETSPQNNSLQGIIWKYGKWNLRQHQRYFNVENNVLYIYQTKQDFQNKAEAKYVFPIKQAKFRLLVASMDGSDCVFRITYKQQKMQFSCKYGKYKQIYGIHNPQFLKIKYYVQQELEQEENTNEKESNKIITSINEIITSIKNNDNIEKDKINELQCLHAFNPLSERLETSVKCLDNLLLVISSRIQSDADHTRALEKVIQSIDNTCVQGGTIGNALSSIITDMKNEYNSRVEFVNQLNEDVYKPLYQVRELYVQNNRRFAQNTKSAIKQLKNSQNKWLKVKSKYDKVVHDHESARSALMNAKSDQNATKMRNQVLKLGAKVNSTAKSQQAMQQKYDEHRLEWNREQIKFDDEMTSILQGMQSNEAVRLQTVGDCLRKWGVFITNLVANRNYDIKSMAEIMSYVTPDKDLQEFMQETLNKNPPNEESSISNSKDNSTTESIGIQSNSSITSTHKDSRRFSLSLSMSQQKRHSSTDKSLNNYQSSYQLPENYSISTNINSPNNPNNSNNFNQPSFQPFKSNSNNINNINKTSINNSSNKKSDSKSSGGNIFTKRFSKHRSKSSNSHSKTLSSIFKRNKNKNNKTTNTNRNRRFDSNELSYENSNTYTLDSIPQENEQYLGLYTSEDQKTQSKLMRTQAQRSDLSMTDPSHSYNDPEIPPSPNRNEIRNFQYGLQQQNSNSYLRSMINSPVVLSSNNNQNTKNFSTLSLDNNSNHNNGTPTITRTKSVFVNKPRPKMPVPNPPPHRQKSEPNIKSALSVQDTKVSRKKLKKPKKSHKKPKLYQIQSQQHQKQTQSLDLSHLQVEKSPTNSMTQTYSKMNQQLTDMKIQSQILHRGLAMKKDDQNNQQVYQKQPILLNNYHDLLDNNRLILNKNNINAKKITSLNNNLYNNNNKTIIKTKIIKNNILTIKSNKLNKNNNNSNNNNNNNSIKLNDNLLISNKN